MPDIDGIQAAKIIKDDDSLAKMPSIILISTYAREDVFVEAQQYLDAYLLKPICQSTFYDCILGIFCQVPRKSYVSFSCESIRSKVVSKFKGKSILLVEDNKTNQEVAINLLNEVQLSVDSVFNGKEAIAKMKGNSYDLVLMDVQMPEMDGISTTKMIRNELKLKVPIVAMTAHAMQGDKDRCLAAGMNDYVTKPIDVEHFYHTLDKWLPEHSSHVETVVQLKSDEQEASSASLSLPEFKGIDYPAALSRLIGNQSLLLKLIANFHQQNQQNIIQLTAAVERNDKVLVKQIVHGVKGEAGNIAANDVFDTAQLLEAALEENSENIPLLHDEFQNAVAVVFGASQVAASYLALSSVNNNLIERIYPENSNEDIHKLLAEIVQLLNKNNLKAKSLIESLVQHLPSTNFELEHAQLNQCMNVLDFKGALPLINVLSDKLRASNVDG